MPELKIQTDRETFLRSIENWDGVKPSFAECAAGALLVAAAAFQGDQFLRGVADEFEAMPSSVAKWATGATSPHPLLRKVVVDCMAKRLKSCLEEADRLHREAHAAFRQMSLAAQATETDDD